MRWHAIAWTHVKPRSMTLHGMTRLQLINSLAPGKFEWKFRHVIFNEILVIDSWGIFCEIALIRMSLDFTEDQFTLVQVMAWCRQATSHYLSQCWLSSLLPCGVTRPQWVNSSVYPWEIVVHDFSVSNTTRGTTNAGLPPLIRYAWLRVNDRDWWAMVAVA